MLSWDISQMPVPDPCALGGRRLIGLLIPDMRNPHYWEIAEGVEDEARTAGYEVLLASTSMNPQREIDTLNALTRRRVDGLILTLSFLDQSRELLRQLSKGRYSVVTLGVSSMDELDRVETGYATADARIDGVSLWPWPSSYWFCARRWQLRISHQSN